VLKVRRQRALAIGFLCAAWCVLPGTGRAASEEQEYNQAWQSYQSGNTVAAIKAFTAYVNRHPRGKFLPEAHFTMARIEPSGNNAFVHYQFIVDNYPGHALASQASFATAQYYQSLGAIPEATARLVATYSRYPATAAGSESLYRLGLLAIAADSMETADRYAQAFWDNYSQHSRGPAMLSALADHWQAMGDTARANPRWREVIDRYPRSGEAGAAREQLLANAGDDEENGADSVLAPVANTRAATAARPALAKGYYVQIGAYTNAGILREWADRLAAKGYTCLVDSASGPGKKTYRLLTGPYPDRNAVQAAAKKLQSKERVNGIILQK
jgi:TolA-binding protein